MKTYKCDKCGAACTITTGFKPTGCPSFPAKTNIRSEWVEVDVTQPQEDGLCWCDTCVHYPKPDSPTWLKAGPNDHNICELKRPMHFKMPPEGAPGDICDEWGHYNKDCRFYEEVRP